MKKDYNAISLNERQNNPDLCFTKDIELSKEYVMSQDIEVVKNGRILHESKKVTIKPSELHEGLKVTDFCIENILAVGATDLLHNTQLNDSSFDAKDAAINDLNNFMDGIETINMSSEL